MKILVVQDWLRSGGTERQSVFLSNSFAAAGHETTLLTFRPGGRIESSLAVEVQRHALQPIDLHLDWFAPGLGRAAARPQPDIVLCMGRMANCLAGGLQRRLPQSVVIGTMRTGKQLPWLFRRSLRAVRHVVANSREARDLLVRQHGLPADRVSVIYNSLVFAPPSRATSPDVADGVRATTAETGVPARPRDSLRGEFGANPGTTVCLCVAMFRPEKNQRELIEIVSELPTEPDCQLWLAGDGPARAECERLVASRGLDARVKFVGFHRDPSALYAAADVAVHASWSESLSNFLIEAQAHGLPAIAYEAQGIRECFVPDRTGWSIPRDDRAAFRAAIGRLMRDPMEARAARFASARAYARTTFDPERQVQAYLDLFGRLTA